MASRRDAIVRAAEPMHIFARSARRSEKERERERERERRKVTFRAPIGSFIRVAGARVVLYNDCVTRVSGRAKRVVCAVIISWLLRNASERLPACPCAV